MPSLLANVIQEQRPCSTVTEIASQRAIRWSTKIYNPILAFRADANALISKINIFNSHSHDFGKATPSGIQQLHECFVPGAFGRS
jgi:hypothetical protein